VISKRVASGIRALRPSRVAAAATVVLNLRTHRTWGLPILLFAPTARCNSRCVSCDWWRHDGATDLSRAEVAALVEELPRLRTKLVVFTGGEPLVRADVFELADLFRARGVTLHLLTSGLALERHAEAVAARFDGVTVSLDGHTPELYRAIRGVDGLAAVERGVRRLREIRPGISIRARSTLQRQNFRHVADLIDKADAIGLDQISFLGADVTSDSFGRRPLALAADPRVALDPGEVDEFARVVDEAIESHAGAFERKKVAERPDKLRRLPAYYRAHTGNGPFPSVSCNAPWVSAVVEADGTVRPCFFQPPVGNLRDKSLSALLRGEMVRFRRGLDVAKDRTCQRCVCTLRLGPRSPVP
jgi:MoaA/NifB/PqqE/SkfB family radical SAM enzyme